MKPKVKRSMLCVGVILLCLASPVMAEDAGRTEMGGNPFLHGDHEPMVFGTVGRGVQISPRAVTANGTYSLDLDDDLDLLGNVFKDGTPFLHNAGGVDGRNTALGLNALIAVTPGRPEFGDGKNNTAVGEWALTNSTTGSGNTAVGGSALKYNIGGDSNAAFAAGALFKNESGARNTAIGAVALFDNVAGSQSTAVGYSALFNSLADSNTAVGYSALYKTVSGTLNTALGAYAGWQNVSGASNIFINSTGESPGTESNTLRIGKDTGTGDYELNQAFIAGIGGVTLGATDPHVCIDTTTDQLGKCDDTGTIMAISSARFKKEIRDLEGESSEIFALRPVKFRYRKEVAGDDSDSERYGLIAEEVAEVLPGLVIYDSEGRPLGVHYDALTPLLLTELKRLRGEVAELNHLRAEVAELRAVLE